MMFHMPAWSRASIMLLALGLAGAVSASDVVAEAMPPAGHEASTAIIDPAFAEWGLLAALEGTRWRPEGGGPLFAYVWVEPGREMRRYTPGSWISEVTIRRGDAPGELIYREGPGAQFTGRANADGSLGFERDFPRGSGFRLSWTTDGKLLREWIRLKDGSVSDPMRYENVSVLHAAAVQAGPSQAADPAVWGVYARLVGTEWAADDAYRAWRWSGHDEILEDRGNQGRYQISPDGSGGLLLRQSGNPGWRGTISADGAVHWTMPVGGRLLNALGGLMADDDRPFRVRLDGDAMIVELVRGKSGGALTATGEKRLHGVTPGRVWPPTVAAAQVATASPVAPPPRDPSPPVIAGSVMEVPMPAPGQQAPPGVQGWGVLGQMAGSRWAAVGTRPQVSTLDVAWMVPGQQLRYEMVDGDGTRTSFQVTQGKKAGQLRFDGRERFTANLLPDGSLVREQRVMLFNKDQLLRRRSENVVDLLLGLYKDGRLYPRDGGVRLVRQVEDAQQQFSISQEVAASELANPAVWQDAVQLAGTKWLRPPGTGTEAPIVRAYDWVIPGELMRVSTMDASYAGESSSVMVFADPAGRGLLQMRDYESHKMAMPAMLYLATIQKTMQPLNEQLRLAMVQEHQAAMRLAQEQEARAKKERSEARWEMFNIVLAGIAGGVEMASNDYQQMQQQQMQMNALQARAEEAQKARERQQQQLQQSQAQQQAQQQQAGRDALARQLASGIAYRNAQAAGASSVAVRQQWLADNERAMQEARRLGIASQVEQQVAAGRSAELQAGAVRQQQEQARQHAEAEAAQRQRQEQQRLATEQAARRTEQQRQVEQADAQRRTEAEQRRQAEEQARQRRQQELAQSLQMLRSSFRGAAVTCPGGGKDVLYLKSSVPTRTQCNSVRASFEARCPGTPQGAGVRFSQSAYIGASCGMGDSIRIGYMDCVPEQVLVTMTDASCG